MNSIFQYNGSPVTFRNESGKLFVNATEMAKQFGSKPESWLRNEQAQRMIQAISASQKCEAADLVQVINGGNNFGTWMHEDVAIIFAP